jgi:hypothetical protein
VDSEIICEFCNKSFGHKNSLYRHKKRYCHNNPIKQEKITKNDLSSEIIALKQRIKELEQT